MGLRSDIDAARSDYTTLQAQINEILMGTPLALQYDQDADPPTIAYLGVAQPGASTAAAVWRIQKLTFNAGGDVVITWADGNGNFDNIWNNRASLTYS